MGLEGLSLRSILFGLFLLGQALLRYPNSSRQEWSTHASSLPTGLTTPRCLDTLVDALFDSGLAKLNDNGTILLDPRVTAAGMVPSKYVLARLLLVWYSAVAPPMWLPSAIGDNGRLFEENVPSADLLVLQDLGLTGDTAQGRAFLLALRTSALLPGEEGWQLGEEAVVDYERQRLEELGRPDLAAAVMRVSVISDHFGFDVASSSKEGNDLCLEVKTSRTLSLKEFSFFLTRHEYDVGRIYPTAWRLVGVQIAGGRPEVLGGLAIVDLAPYVPSDGGGRWTEAQLKVPRALFRPYD